MGGRRTATCGGCGRDWRVEQSRGPVPRLCPTCNPTSWHRPPKQHILTLKLAPGHYRVVGSAEPGYIGAIYSRSKLAELVACEFFPGGVFFLHERSGFVYEVEDKQLVRAEILPEIVSRRLVSLGLPAQ